MAYTENRKVYQNNEVGKKIYRANISKLTLPCNQIFMFLLQHFLKNAKNNFVW